MNIDGIDFEDGLGSIELAYMAFLPFLFSSSRNVEGCGTVFVCTTLYRVEKRRIIKLFQLCGV